MSRKDFEALAAIVRNLSLPPNLGPAVRLVIASDMAKWLKTTNPRFNAVRFLVAATGYSVDYCKELAEEMHL